MIIVINELLIALCIMYCTILGFQSFEIQDRVSFVPGETLL